MEEYLKTVNSVNGRVFKDSKQFKTAPRVFKDSKQFKWKSI